MMLLSLAVSLSACSGINVEESPRPDDPVGVTDKGLPERDLALTDLSISPDLSRAIDLTGGATSFRLQATVENRGTADAANVLVEAWLRVPAQNGGMVLMQGVELAPEIAAGETQVIQITASGVVPILPSYVLEVSVRPALEEQFLSDNVAQYEISVSLTDSPLG